jgi:hypothetical protein
MRNRSKILATCLLAALLAACATHERGPFENAGHEIDKGVEKVDRTASKAGDKVEQGAKDTGNALDRFGHKVGDFFSGLFD